MSFELVETYLFLKGIELNEKDYSFDGGRIQLVDNLIPNEPMELRLQKWDFNIPKPTLDDLNKIDTKDIEKMRKRKEKKQKLKQAKSFQFPILDDDDLLNLTLYDGMIYISQKDGSLYYYYNGKLQKVRVFENV